MIVFEVFPNIIKDINLINTNKLLEWLENRDCRVYISESFSGVVKERKNLSFGTSDRSDFYLVLGGDGSIIRAAKRAAQRRIPLIGINLGRLGYMAQIETNELERLDALFLGQYIIENRMMLDVVLNRGGKEPLKTIPALNDAVVAHGAGARLIDIELQCKNEVVSRYRGDGLIASTPTGSTAYSMSAGGPIIDPGMNCICITPICPHSLYARPVIFSADSMLTVKNISGENSSIYLTVDGIETYTLGKNESVCVTQSKYTTGLVRILDKKMDSSFYGVLNRKMTDI